MRCDAGVSTGVGHLIRCVALAEEFVAQGAQAEFFGSVEGVPWAMRQLDLRRLALYPGPTTPIGLVEAARRHRLDAMVLDSYELDPEGAGTLRAAGVVTVAIIDGDSRGQAADIYLDQNLGAGTPADPTLPGRTLAGTSYALLRSAILAARPAAPPPPVPVERPRVLAFFGGTDAFGAAPVLTRLLLSTGQPVDLTVVVSRPAVGAELSAVAPGPDQSVRLVPPTDDLPSLVRTADLVISAAGTSTWELCCLGAPTALVCVVDNQREAYARVVAHGLAAGLGRLGDLAGDGPGPRAARSAAVRTLRELLGSPAHRATLAARAWSAVDGRGRGRVVDAVLREISAVRD